MVGQSPRRSPGLNGETLQPCPFWDTDQAVWEIVTEECEKKGLGFRV